MKKIRRPIDLPKAETPVSPPVDQPLIDIMMAQRELIGEIQQLTQVVIDSKKGPLQIDIQRDGEGRMKTLLVERIALN